MPPVHPFPPCRNYSLALRLQSCQHQGTPTKLREPVATGSNEDPAPFASVPPRIPKEGPSAVSICRLHHLHTASPQVCLLSFAIAVALHVPRAARCHLGPLRRARISANCWPDATEYRSFA